jgi:hypothetical protein
VESPPIPPRWRSPPLEGANPPPAASLRLVLPLAERRAITLNGAPVAPAPAQVLGAARQVVDFTP